MNISNKDLFTWSSPINRYSYLSQLLPQNRNQDQNNAFPVSMNIPANNYSYFTSLVVADDFKELGKAAQSLNLGKTGNIFEKTGATATSSNAKAVTAKAANGAAAGSYTLQVNQIAKAQENAGNWADAKAKTLAANGSRTLAVTITDPKGYIQKNANINVQTKADQTNQNVLTQTADAINKQSKELGVQARVESRTVNGVEQARLVVSGTKTGTNTGSFAIKDTIGTLAANTGVKNVTTVAQNAKYTLNGTARESQSNEVAVDRLGKVKATLVNSTAQGETVNISIKPQDTNAIYDTVKGFVSQYNQTIHDLASPENRFAAATNQYFGLTRMNGDRGKLTSIGITVNDDRTLDFNEARFKNALAFSPDKVREILGGTNGFAAKVETIAGNVDLANSPILRMNQNSQNNPSSYFPGKFFNYYL